MYFWVPIENSRQQWMKNANHPVQEKLIKPPHHLSLFVRNFTLFWTSFHSTFWLWFAWKSECSESWRRSRFTCKLASFSTHASKCRKGKPYCEIDRKSLKGKIEIWEITSSRQMKAFGSYQAALTHVLLSSMPTSHRSAVGAGDFQLETFQVY